MSSQSPAVRALAVRALAVATACLLHVTAVAAAAAAAATVTATGAVLHEDVQGFGVEWDPMLLQADNVAAGVTDEDVALVAERLAALGVPVVRMFLRVSWWEPVRGIQTFDDRAMASLWAQLDACQAAGVSVVLVLWRLDPHWLSAWDSHPAELARTTADLLQEIEARGYDVVRWLTVGDEPDAEQTGGVAAYVDLVGRVAAELSARGLGVDLVGPDVSGDLDWFGATVPALGGTFAAFAAHSWDLDGDSVAGIEEFVSRRRALLAAEPAAAGKPFWITEFGSSAGVDPFTSGDIGTFERGLFSAEGGLRALNAGAAAVLHWCLHDVFYDEGGRRMGYGLFAFRDEGWRPRPVFHAWSLLSRFAPRGSRVLALTAADPRLVAAAVERPDGGLTLWLLNRDGAALDVAIDLALAARAPGSGAVPRYRYVADALPEGGAPVGPDGSVAATAGGWTDRLPPRSLTAYVAPGPPPPPGPDAAADAASDALGAADAGGGPRADGGSGGGGGGGCDSRPRDRATPADGAGLALVVLLALVARAGAAARSTASPQNDAAGR